MAERSVDAAGDEFVIWADPANRLYPGGLNRQRTRPLLASIASVLPYVVVTKNTSWLFPLTLTSCR